MLDFKFEQIDVSIPKTDLTLPDFGVDSFNSKESEVEAKVEPEVELVIDEPELNIESE